MDYHMEVDMNVLTSMECRCCKHFAIVLILSATGLSLVAVGTSHWSEYRQDENTTDRKLSTIQLISFVDDLVRVS